MNGSQQHSNWALRRVARAILAATAIGFAGALPVSLAESTAASPDRNVIALEALKRLKGLDLESNPTLKQAVLRVLESVRGTPQFVELVRDFKIQGQESDLIEIALQNSTHATGTDAARMLLETERGIGLLKENLNAAQPETVLKTVVLLGNTGDQRVVPMLLEIVKDRARPLPVRQHAVQFLARTQAGAHELLTLAKNDLVAPDLKLAASTELNHARWPEIKSAAAELLPLPQTANAEPLPPISDLVRRTGDAKRGAEVFAREIVACSQCHQVNGRGIDFGPNLSEIGTKLGKDALYASILDPSAGISFGYEGWQIELKNGDEAFGLIVSETADELAVKAQNGIVTRYKKSDIARRVQMTNSVMPSGLQAAMSVQDLVDLVEYLASLKKQRQASRD